MTRWAAVLFCLASALLLTGFAADEASPGLSGTIQLSVGATVGSLAVVLLNLHRHSVRSETRHVEQEAKLKELIDRVHELEARVTTLLGFLRKDLT